MKTKMIWGLGVLIIGLIIGGVFLLRPTDTDTEKRYRYTEPEAPIADKPPREAKEGYKWVRYNDRWDEVPITQGDASAPVIPSADEQQADDLPSLWSLPPEVQKKIFDQAYIQHGLEPPPAGYEYRWAGEWVPLLDENGKPILHKIDEPIIEIRMGIGFAPTKEEYEKWEQLLADRVKAIVLRDDAEVKRIEAEIEAFEASVQRMRPIGASAASLSDEAASKADRLAEEKMNAALRGHGLEHLISPY